MRQSTTLKALVIGTSALSFVCLFAIAPAFADAATSQDALKQLSALASLQRESLAKIKSYEITITEHRTYNLNGNGMQPFVRTTEHHECTRGQDSCAERTEHTVSKGKNGEHANDDQWRVVSNNNYSADWLVGTDGAFVWHANAPASAPVEATTENVRDNLRSPIRFGYGEGEGLLTDLYKRASAQQVANLAVAKNDSIYVMTYADKQAGTSEELTVDSAKGFLITRTVTSKAGVPCRVVSVEPKEVEQGVWFPSIWDVTDYNAQTKTAEKPAVMEHTRNELQSVRINPQFSDDTFTLKALQLAPSVKIACPDPSGKAPTQFLSQTAYVKRHIQKDGSEFAVNK